MEETAPRSPNLKTCGEFISNYVYHGIVHIIVPCVYRTNFFQHFIIYFREAHIIVGWKYTTLYLFLKIETYNTGPSTRGRDPLPQFFLYKKFILFFFCYFFSGDVLLFQTWILILNVFLNLNNYSIFTLEPRRFLSHLKLSVIWNKILHLILIAAVKIRTVLLKKTPIM